MKNKFKIASILIAIIIMISTFCFAEDQTPIEPRTTDVEQINNTDEAVTTNLENETTAIEEEQEIYEGDLYIFEDTVNMNKLVDGNVYIIGKDVTITGQIAGNLFVIAENLTVGDNTSASSYNGYVFYNIYALANKATLYSSCYDLYVAGNDITIEDSFYLYRDLKIGASNANIFGTIGRNIDAEVTNLNLKKTDSSYASIYGDLNYSSVSELDEETLKTCVNGVANYSSLIKSDVKEDAAVMTYVEEIAIKVLFTIFVWLIILMLSPKFLGKASTLINKKTLSSLGIGLLTLITVPIICLILLIMVFTFPISFIGIILYVLAISISFSLVCIAITYALKDKLKLDKWYKILVVLVLVRILLYLIGLIPFVGGIVDFIALILGLGLIVNNISKNKIKESEVIIEENEK